MQISKIEVRNYRAIQESEMLVDALTAIIGENNSGKSTFIRAIDLFFSSSPRVQKEDFFQHDIARPIEITIEFSNLCPHERDVFGSKLIANRLRVTRCIRLDSGAQYLVDAMVNPAFAEVRSAQGKAEKRNLFNALANDYDLPKVKSADEVEDYLSAWESRNPEALERQKISDFFGAENVASGKLKTKTEFVFIPAVKDARDELKDSKSSPVRALLSGIARQAIENSEEYQNFLKEAEERLAILTAPDNAPELAGISEALTEIMSRYYSDTALRATWDELSNLPISLPIPDVRVNDGVIETNVEYVGHGMQRAIIFTLLEYMARQKYISEEGDGFAESQSDIIISIEEPELFQHPTKQRLISAALSKISDGFNRETGIRIQVIYATHSPLLVSLPSAHRIRAMRRVDNDEGRQIIVSSTSMEDCATTTAALWGKEPSVDRYSIGLHVVTTEIAEAFFATAAILVEGISDVAILSAYYLQMGRDPLAEGIAIKSVDGKRKLDKPFLILTRLGVPTFLIFDNDQSDKRTRRNEKSEIAWNIYLQRLAGMEEKEASEWPDLTTHNLSAWDGNIESYIEETVGTDVYKQVLNATAEMFNLTHDECAKSPTVAAAVLRQLLAKGHTFDRLHDVLVAVDALKAVATK